MDTNIVIYTFKPEYTHLLNRLEETGEVLACSEIVRLEVMGFHGLHPKDATRLAIFFGGIKVVPISSQIIDVAIGLRQQKAIGSPDAIIAATALIAKEKLWTNNEQDFKWIKNLQWHNPVVKRKS